MPVNGAPILVDDYTLFASSRGDGTIFQIDSNGLATVFASGLGQPHEIVVDQNRNLLVADVELDRIHQITPSGDILDYSVFGSGFDNPEGLALRSDGTLFVSGTFELNASRPSNSLPNDLIGISPEGIASGFAKVGVQENLSVDINDNDVLFVTDSANGGSIWSILPTGC